MEWDVNTGQPDSRALTPELFPLYPPCACGPLLPPARSPAHSRHSAILDTTRSSCRKCPGRPEVVAGVANSVCQQGFCL